jgi:hypothetical protein
VVPVTEPLAVEPAPSDPAAAPLGVPVPRHLGDILVTIRLIESGNDYTIGKNRGGASGAYQYIDSTWNNYAGYPSAFLAPASVQDERALSDVQAILRTWNNDVSMIPVIWYYPKAAREPALMDIVPLPQAGNRLTVREYQMRWLEVLAQVTGDELILPSLLLPPDLRFLAGIPPELSTIPASAVTGPEGLMIAYPVLGRSVVTPPVACDRAHCEEGTDAVIYGQKLQPVLAVADGVVTAVDRSGAVDAAITVTITDVDGRSYRYSGFNDDSPGTSDGAGHPALGLSVLAQVGTSVRAGQILGFVGDTDPMPGGGRPKADEAVWPHLRLTIRDAEGTRLDADRLVVAAQTRQACHVGTGPWALPADPRLMNPDDAELLMLTHAVIDAGDDPAENPALTPDGYSQIEPVDVSALVDGGFRINADGTVRAHGAAALIRHPLGCSWAPTQTFGAGAAGAEAPLAWLDPITLPARVWVTATVSNGTPGLPTGVLLGR